MAEAAIQLAEGPEAETRRLSTNRKVTIPGAFYYVTGIGILGLLIGVLAGLSQTPVVNTVLPLLFGLIAGGSGFFLTNAAIDSPIPQARLSLIGKSLAGLCVGALIGLGYGISVRTGNFPVPSQVISSDLPLPKEALSTTAVTVRAIALQNQLRKLGATKSEIDHIMQDTFVTHPNPSTSSLDALLEELRRILIIAAPPKSDTALTITS